MWTLIRETRGPRPALAAVELHRRKQAAELEAEKRGRKPKRMTLELV